MANVLVIAETFKGRLKKATFSAATVARSLAEKGGGSVDALVLGSGVAAIADSLKGYGFRRVLLADSPAFANYIAEIHAGAIEHLIRSEGYSTVLAASSAWSKDLVPRLAAKFRAGMASEVCGLDVSGSMPVFGRPVWAGNAIAWVTIETPIQFLTVRATEFEAIGPGADSPIVSVDLQPSTSCGVRYVEFRETKSERPELTEARVVVSGGRGCKGPDGFKLLEELADTLGAAVGASRAAVDAGWVPNDLQVGQTGKIVAPDLYVGAGVSGAIQHLAGMKGSKVIVAINKDEEAPIFQVADYGLVGDLFKAIPELTAALKALR
jgi:electron transfer flavoprotein alpha subunit